MNKLPKFPSNKKCWKYLNRLAFGVGVAAPSTMQPLEAVLGCTA